MPTISLPRGRIPKVNLASWRQAVFSNPPALHLTPVKSWRRKIQGRDPNIASPVTSEDANHSGGCGEARIMHRVEGATNSTLSDEWFSVTKNWGIRDRMKSPESFIAFVDNALRIDIHSL